MKAAVMVPTYNEAGNLTALVDRILSLENTPEQSGVDRILMVVVDDNSPDGTGAMADALAAQHPGSIHVIHRAERGRGSAGIAGFKYILTQDIDYILEMDADLSHDPADIPRLIAVAKDYDIAIGSRRVRGGSMGSRNFYRMCVTTGASLYARLMLGWGIKEWHSGYKCYRKKVLASLDFDKFLSQGYSIGMETVYRAVKKGYTIKEIPIIFRERTQGRSNFLSKKSWFILKWSGKSVFR